MHVLNSHIMQISPRRIAQTKIHKNPEEEDNSVAPHSQVGVCSFIGTLTHHRHQNHRC
jgi:hypothetical protein